MQSTFDIHYPCYFDKYDILQLPPFLRFTKENNDILHVINSYIGSPDFAEVTLKMNITITHWLITIFLISENHKRELTNIMILKHKQSIW